MAQAGSNDKNRGSKISLDCPFKILDSYKGNKQNLRNVSSILRKMTLWAMILVYVGIYQQGFCQSVGWGVFKEKFFMELSLQFKERD